MSTGTAVEREAAWLAQSGDTLPALLASAGGPWDVVQPWWPGARERTQAHGIYVLARTIADERVSNQRIRPQYEFILTCVWPVKGTGGNAPLAEGEQHALADATDLVLRRVRGLLGDKTHGGRFLSVGETRRPVVTLEDPAITIPANRVLRQGISYSADDYELNG